MSNSSIANQRPGFLLAAILTFVTIAYVLLPTLLFPVISIFTNVQMIDVMSSLDQPPIPIYQITLLIVQGIASAIAFILIPVLFVKFSEKVTLKSYLNGKRQYLVAYLILSGATISFMVFNSIFIEWNMNLQFPEPIHDYFKTMEDLAEKATNYIISFHSFSYFFAAIIVVALLPALGEELLFRGLVQRYTEKLFGNAHVAIWVTAFAFSAFHMQFFGFVPRMTLGVFFGYLLYFSGNLWYAIAAHFINNGFTLVMLYLYQQGVINYNIENTDSIPLQTVAIFFIIGVILFGLFIGKFKSNSFHRNG